LREFVKRNVRPGVALCPSKTGSDTKYHQSKWSNTHNLVQLQDSSSSLPPPEPYKIRPTLKCLEISATDEPKKFIAGMSAVYSWMLAKHNVHVVVKSGNKEATIAQPEEHDLHLKSNIIMKAMPADSCYIMLPQPVENIMLPQHVEKDIQWTMSPPRPEHELLYFTMLYNKSKAEPEDINDVFKIVRELEELESRWDAKEAKTAEQKGPAGPAEGSKEGLQHQIGRQGDERYRKMVDMSRGFRMILLKTRGFQDLDQIEDIDSSKDYSKP